MSIQVSIIVPSYEHAPFLQQRLESVFEQTYQNYELILLDDASKDGSATILKQYAQHPKVNHLIINKENSGSPFKQWQKGIELAKGKYIWIAESDDWADNHFLEKTVPLLEKDDEIVVAYAQSLTIDKEGNTLQPYIEKLYKIDTEKWKTPYVATGKEETLTALIYQNTLPNASAVVFRKVKNIIAILPKGMKYCGDWWFWIQLLRQGKIAYTPEELNHFRYHGGTTRAAVQQSVRLRRLKERLDILTLIESAYPEARSLVRSRKARLLASVFQIAGWSNLSNTLAESRLYMGHQFAFLFGLPYLVKQRLKKMITK